MAGFNNFKSYITPPLLCCKTLDNVSNTISYKDTKYQGKSLLNFEGLVELVQPLYIIWHQGKPLETILICLALAFESCAYFSWAVFYMIGPGYIKLRTKISQILMLIEISQPWRLKCWIVYVVKDAISYNGFPTIVNIF